MTEIRKLCAGYPGKQVLDHISLSIPGQQVTVILGPNGCGKSTLLKALCGILPAADGEVWMDGTELLGLTGKQRAQKVSYLAQSRRIPDITVRRMVLHGRFPYLSYPRRYRAEDYGAADAAMEKMGITTLAEEPLQNLSGGQRQKVYIAMALAQDTQVILLDEPTTFLDISHQLQLMEQARLLAKQGKTVVMILHDLPHAFQTADKLVLMDSGAIAAEGTPEELYAGGMVNRIFRVKLGRVRSDAGWRYYCETAMP